MITYNALILGSESQIGKEILSISESFPNFKFFFKNKSQLDIRINKLIQNFIIKNKINLIINCAAFTNVDLAEKQKKKCLLINYNAIKNKPLTIYGKGKNSREWIYVNDHCDALIKIFEKGKIGNFYNIGSNFNINNLKVTKLLLRCLKKKLKLARK